MSFCLRSHKVRSQLGKSAAAIILLQVARASRWDVTGTNDNGPSARWKHKLNPKGGLTCGDDVSP